MVLGALQVNDAPIFDGLHRVFRYSPLRFSYRDLIRDVTVVKDTIREINPFVKSAPAKRLLAEHFILSETEQEDALLRCSQLWYERATESGFTPLPGQREESGLREPPDIDLFDPFLDGNE